MSERTLHVGKRDIRITHDDKVLFPDVGITKGGLVDYYAKVAPYAVKLWRGHPVSMQRYPDGIAGKHFFQKDAPDYFPAWVARCPLEKSEGHNKHVVINDAETVAYLASQACIVAHLGLARCDKPHHPDRMIFDLDPSDDDFNKVRRAALWTKNLLDELGLPSLPMATGSRGLHVMVPLDRSADFDEVKAFSRAVARTLAAQHPDELTVEMRKNKRGDRVFVDILRNDYAQTAVAPFSVRARTGAPVATPLAWSEVRSSKLRPDKYTIGTLFQRLARRADPWKGARSCSLARAEKRLAKTA